MSDDTDSRAAYPELLADLADQVAIKCVSLGIDPGQAADIGWQCAEHIREHWGGGGLYMPKGVAYELSQRDARIYQQFNGTNHTALARQYDLTEMRIYQIIKRARAAHVAKIQPALF